MNAYMLLQPHSGSNPTDMFRVVHDDEWTKAVNSGKPTDYPVFFEDKDYKAARHAADEANAPLRDQTADQAVCTAPSTFGAVARNMPTTCNTPLINGQCPMANMHVREG